MTSLCDYRFRLSVRRWTLRVMTQNSNRRASLLWRHCLISSSEPQLLVPVQVPQEGTEWAPLAVVTHHPIVLRLNQWVIFTFKCFLAGIVKVFSYHHWGSFFIYVRYLTNINVLFHLSFLFRSWSMLSVSSFAKYFLVSGTVYFAVLYQVLHNLKPSNVI